METLQLILDNNTLTKKQKTQKIVDALVNKEISISTLIEFAKVKEVKIQTICMESLEYLSNDNANAISSDAFNWAIEGLKQSDASLKRESARVIGNSSAHHKEHLEAAITYLIPLTEDKGTIVRWAAAYALSRIILLETKWNEELLPILKSILNIEENNGVKNQYIKALKRLRRI